MARGARRARELTSMTQATAGATTDIAERLRAQAESRRPVRVVGAGTWLRAGAAVNATDTLSVADARGIVEYVAGDFTITVRAGTTLREISDATRAHDQFLTLDPWGGDRGTIGATVATATAGPRAAGFGLPRDAVLGMEFVSGAGRVIRAGGRVVKNVAGFDLVRLLTGAWGTLGVITELTLRLRALPECQESIAVAIDGDARAVAELARRVRALPFTFFALQLVNAPLARRAGLRDATTLLAQIGGNARSVAAQREALAAVGRGAETVGDDVWRAVRECDADAVASWRWSRPPSEFAQTWTRASRVAEAHGGVVHADPSRGVARVVVSTPARELARSAGDFDGSIVIELLPTGSWPVTTSPERLARLSRDVRARFDPAGILNPGILGAT